MRLVSRLIPALAVVIIMFAGAAPLHADLNLIDMFRNVEYNQTSGAAPAVPSFYFVNLEAGMANPGDFTSVTVSYPGPGSPDTLTLESSTEFGEGVSFATLSDMNAAYPTGTYTFSASGGSSPAEMASLAYALDAFTSDIPALTASTFAALQGMNPADPFTFNFNSFTMNPDASFGNTYLTVFGSSYTTGALPNTATSAVMPGGTLLPDTTYTYELDFIDRITGVDPLNGVPTEIGFDVRTDGTFTTAPEPSTMIPLALAFVGVSAGRLRRA